MKIEELSLSAVKPYAKNPRKNDGAVNGVAESIKQFGFQQPIVIDKNNVIVVGHTRYKAAQQLGLEKVPCVRADQLTKEQVKAYRILDNKLNELATWDFEALSEELKSFKFDFSGFDVDFSSFKFDGFDEELKGKYDSFTPGSLRDIYITPPFSVLESKSGAWAKRKQIWNPMLRSGEGRKENLLTEGLRQHAKASGANLTGTSIFDPVLCETLYHWFCPPNGKVIDPFAGGSTRGMIASFMERTYVGVDVSQEQIDADEKCFKNLKNMTTLQGNALERPEWICADARDILKVAGDKGPFDFLISCPPYFDLEQYSDDERDLSNLSWEDFLTAYRQIYRDAVSLLNDDTFAVVVVGEVRNNKSKNGKYVNLVSETINALTHAGTDYYNEIILVNSFTTAGLRARTIFGPTRKVVKVHQNVLVFVKGDARKAASKMSNEVDWFKDVDEDEDDS